MYKNRSRTLIVWLFTVLALCLATPDLAQAGNITVPWMTGYFRNDASAFDVWGFSPDGQYFLIDFSLVTADPTLIWDCDEYGFCYGQGWASMTSGTTYGSLWDRPGGKLEASFTGSMLAGGVYEQVWKADWEYLVWLQYSYDFAGVWTNSWQTFGTGYGSVANDAIPYGYFTLTTNTPEPATITLIGLGLAGISIRRKRRI